MRIRHVESGHNANAFRVGDLDIKITDVGLKNTPRHHMLTANILNFIESKKEPREGPKQELNRNRQADVLMAASDESSHFCILVRSSKSYHQFLR
jgi:hypothetical protein